MASPNGRTEEQAFQSGTVDAFSLPPLHEAAFRGELWGVCVFWGGAALSHPLSSMAKACRAPRDDFAPERNRGGFEMRKSIERASSARRGSR
jgi:hypothetical protein